MEAMKLTLSIHRELFSTKDHSGALYTLNFSQATTMDNSWDEFHQEGLYGDETQKS